MINKIPFVQRTSQLCPRWGGGTPRHCPHATTDGQDSTVGVADVMAVMTQLEKKLPLLLALGTKVQVSADGMIVRPTVSGSLTQSQLKAKLEARKAADEDVDVNREITAADLTVKDLTAGVAIDFSKKFNAAFAQNGTFKRVGDDAVVSDAPASPDASGGSTSGGGQKPGGGVETEG